MSKFKLQYGIERIRSNCITLRNMSGNALSKKDERRAAGERLRQARQAAGYANPIDFYNAFDIPQGTLANHEGGSRGFDASEARRYAELLGNVTAGWLLTGEGDPPSILPAKSALGKRARVVQAEVPGDPKQEVLDKKLLHIWDGLDDPIKVVVLQVIEAISSLHPRKL